MVTSEKSPATLGAMAKAVVASVDAYIAQQAADAQPVLMQVRRIIQKAVPKADEAISYQIPTYELAGKPVLYFAGWKKHFSLYPASERLVAAFERELSKYEVQKGTIRFPLNEPVPAKLIERIAKLRAKEALEHAETKAPAKKKARASAAPKRKAPTKKASPAKKATQATKKPKE